MNHTAGYATRKIHKSEILIERAERFKPKYNQGLTVDQVLQREKQKLTNGVKRKISKSWFEIIRANLLSFFNILLYAIAIAMLIVRNYSGLFFVVILVANSVIGIIQDIRAKKTLEKLSVLSKNTVKVVREGVKTEIERSQIVLDDVVVVKMGDQIPADGVVIFGEVSVNEALLTGESEIIKKSVDSTVLSGAFVTSGTAYIRVDKIGKLNYAQTIQLRAQAFKRPKSQLLSSINSLFKIIGIIVISVGALMIFSAIYQETDLFTSVSKISGSLVGMIPSGMYLLTSMTLSVGVVRLGKKRTLVQEMYSIEMLARVDVLCLDKTGTLTDGTMEVSDVFRFNLEEEVDVDNIIANILAATKDENPTAIALKQRFVMNEMLPFSQVTTFSSEAKYSALRLKNGETYYIGATTSLLNDKTRAQIRDIEKIYTNRGLRVLVLTKTKKRAKEQPINEGMPVALIAIEDHIRYEALAAIKWFIDNGVKIKIISGDDVGTVQAVSIRTGVFGAENAIDLSNLSDEEVRKVADSYTVFGRVKPNQKEIIVRKLQQYGMVVGMVGDGVNDVLALKAADCSIAMANGSATARGVSNLIIEQNFDALPSIVSEGRRAINNLQRTWSLFLVKTSFTIILSIFFIVGSILAPVGGQVAYPFETNNLYIWEFFTIGVASFFLSLQPNDNKIKGTFMTNVLKRALPGSIVMVIAVFSFFIMRNVETIQPGSLYVTERAAIVMSVLTMTFISFVVLFRTSLPLDIYRGILFVALLIGAIAAISTDIVFRMNLFKIDYRDLNTINIIELVVINIVAVIMFIVLDYQLMPRKKKRN